MSGRPRCICFSALLILVFLILLSGCRRTEVRKETWFTWFDTVSALSCYNNDSDKVYSRRVEGVEEVLERWNKLLDIYHEYSGVNNLCTINANAGGEAVEVDKDLIDFLLFAKNTCGNLNVMFGSVLKLWHGARTAEQPYVPDTSALLKANKHVSIDSLVIDAEACTVQITDAEASIDVGAIGKGWAAEKAAEWLKADGANGYVIDLGGNIRLVGTKPDGSGWNVGIKDPSDLNKTALILNLKDCSCVTSGSYERFFTVGTRRYSHIIDPATLFPADRYASVSVITENSALADALSTQLSLLPPDAAKQAAQNAGAECILIYPDGTLDCTPGINSLLVEQFSKLGFAKDEFGFAR